MIEIKKANRKDIAIKDFCNTVILHLTPFGNCQLFTIGLFENFFTHVNKTTEQLERFLVIASKLNDNKGRCLINVNDYTHKKILKLLNEDLILSDSSYVNRYDEDDPDEEVILHNMVIDTGAIYDKYYSEFSNIKYNDYEKYITDGK